MRELSNEYVIQKQYHGVEYLQFRKLLQYPEIEHCYTMRQSGINFKMSEKEETLQKSYDKICDVVNFNRNHIVKPHQTHTDRVEIVQGEKRDLNEVDGLITNKKNITLCTTSADCTSLLLYDPEKKVIGDVHSGWRGTQQKIGQKAVIKMMEQYQCNPKDIICCICPHIRKCHFEVGEDVAKLFFDTFSYMGHIEKIITKSTRLEQQKINPITTKTMEMEQKYYIDTAMINYHLLQEVGVQSKNIIDSGICTVCEKEHFHSYRSEKEASGRNGAMIMLKDEY